MCSNIICVLLSRRPPPINTQHVPISEHHLNDLDVEQEVQYVTVFYYVVFTLSAHLTGFLSALLTFKLDEIVVGNGLSSNKAAFKIGMNNSSSLRCRSAYRNRPGPNFFNPSSKVSL